MIAFYFILFIYFFFLQFFWFFENFWDFRIFSQFLLLFFWIFLDLFWTLDFFGFYDFLKVFEFFLDFFWFFGIPFKVTKVTTKAYQGYYWTPKIAKIGPKQNNKLFFCPKGQKSLCQSPPQELEVGLRSGRYLLVLLNEEVSISTFRPSFNCLGVQAISGYTGSV